MSKLRIDDPTFEPKFNAYGTSDPSTVQILLLKLIVDWQTDQPTDIATYRAAIEANNMATTTTATATTVTTTYKTTMTTIGF